MNKFEGSSSISSADLFGNGDKSRNKSSSGYYSSGPDFQDVKDSVKQGVSKVAGRLSNIASGVMSSLQVCIVLYMCFIAVWNVHPLYIYHNNVKLTTSLIFNKLIVQSSFNWRG